MQYNNYNNKKLKQGPVMQFLQENHDIPVLEIQKELNKIPNFAGIYAYININNGGIYIGKSKNLRIRFSQHLISKWTDKNSIDYQLQTYPELFDYRLLIYGVEPNDLILTSLEATYIERYDTVRHGYNKRFDINSNVLENKSESQIVKLYQQLRKDFIILNQKNLRLEKENKELKQRNKNQAAILKNNKLIQ